MNIIYTALVFLLGIIFSFLLIKYLTDNCKSINTNTNVIVEHVEEEIPPKYEDINR